MPLYAYKGVGPSGKSVTGTYDSDSPKGLRQSLRKDGIVVTSFDVKKGKAKALGAGKGLSREVNFGSMFNPVKRTDVASMTRQLATLIKAGIPLTEALGALFEQADNVKLKSILGQVRTEVNEGSSLGDALGKHEQAFDTLYVSMVRAGETAGNLDEVLGRLAGFMESAEKLKAKVQSAMTYPIIMLVFGVLIIGVMMVFVVPNITQVFADQGMKLPIHTRMLVASADAVSNYWWLMFAAIGLGVFLFRRWSKSEAGQPVWHRFILKLPIAGDIYRHVGVSRFCRTVGTMLEAGVPMLQTLSTGKSVLGNVILETAVEKAGIAVMEGESLAKALAQSGEFPSTVIKMIAVGERSGTLENMLISISEAYDNEIELKLGRFTSVIEPAMLVGMGGVVVFIVFSILQPLLQMQKEMSTF